MTKLCEFFHDGTLYCHHLNVKNDSIALTCSGRGTLLIYSSNGECDYGRFSVIDELWCFTCKDSGQIIKGPSVLLPESLIDFEVTISKHYLSDLEQKEVESPCFLS